MHRPKSLESLPFSTSLRNALCEDFDYSRSAVTFRSGFYALSHLLVNKVIETNTLRIHFFLSARSCLFLCAVLSFATRQHQPSDCYSSPCSNTLVIGMPLLLYGYFSAGCVLSAIQHTFCVGVITRHTSFQILFRFLFEFCRSRARNKYTGFCCDQYHK